MPKVNPEIQAFARIKVVGPGGSGRNAINHMVRSKVGGVEFIVANTDAQDLHNSLASRKIHIGKNLTRGLGTGMNPELGRRAAEETKEEIQEALKGADMVFIASGMGGGTGTGAAPIIAKTARELGALTIAVVTKPFFFEGAQRMNIAEKGLEALEAEVDALIVIPNDKLLNTSKDTTLLSAFAQCDEVLRQAVEGISDLITTPGLINVDFADIRAVLADAGTALMGIGVASGENRAVAAAELAINSPLLDISITGARGVLFAIAGSEDMTMNEIQEAAKVITESVDANAKVIFGAIIDPKLRKGEIKITVIASGFPEASGRTKEQKDRTAQPGKRGRGDETLFAEGDEKLADAVHKDKSGAERAIWNSLPSEKSRAVPVKRDEKEAEEDDDLGVIPSFLRRSKLR
ncbi:MAG: cell division protein FtsZ [bacterium]|nr:cell division protein FtsZ [bacterium]